MLLQSLYIGLASLLLPATVSAHPTTSPSVAERQASPFAGYLFTSFTDANHTVDWHLSNGNDPVSYTHVNGGNPVLRSTVGTRGVRDMYLIPNADRTQWYMIATDLDINAPGFNWDQATRTGSRSFVVWTSSNLVDWSESRLVEVEASTAGMAWAPSVVYDADTSLFNVFWSTRLFAESDPAHTGSATPERLRYATTSDFVTFSAPQDYLSAPNLGVIDQEFQNLGSPDHWARFMKNTGNQWVYQEESTTGIFGEWTRKPGFVYSAVNHEGAASFPDNQISGRYYLLLDDYIEYFVLQTDDIESGVWNRIDTPNFPRLRKHGVVTALTAEEYDRVRARYIG